MRPYNHFPFKNQNPRKHYTRIFLCSVPNTGPEVWNLGQTYGHPGRGGGAGGAGLESALRRGEGRCRDSIWGEQTSKMGPRRKQAAFHP